MYLWKKLRKKLLFTQWEECNQMKTDLFFQTIERKATDINTL